MNILFIHQNFPGQYLHLAPALASAGHKCVALTLRVEKPTKWNGVDILPYKVQGKQQDNVHPWILSFDTKITRGEACFQAARRLKRGGFRPDLIIAHPGWGEPLFLKDVWPDAKLALYSELYYRADYPHTRFDPEFSEHDDMVDAIQLRLKNLHNDMLFSAADAGLSPTHFQASTYPTQWREKTTVIHDGIRTQVAQPNLSATLTLEDGTSFSRQDEVITFVNRNLEPYRGYHVFMRALPALLKARPNAQVLIVGSDGVSYGAAPPSGQSWKQIFIDEVRGRIPTPDWNRVQFLGHLPYEKFLSLLQISRAHVYLTYPFVLSWSLLEAMSIGTPIIASDTAPVRELITEGETGSLVDFFDGDALVAKVSQMLDDKDQRQRFAQASRGHIVANYDLHAQCLPAQIKWVNGLMNAT